MVPVELKRSLHNTLRVGVPCLQHAIERQDWDDIIYVFELLVRALEAFVGGCKIANEIYNDERGRPSQYFVHPLDEV